MGFGSGKTVNEKRGGPIIGCPTQGPSARIPSNRAVARRALQACENAPGKRASGKRGDNAGHHCFVCAALRAPF